VWDQIAYNEVLLNLHKEGNTRYDHWLQSTVVYMHHSGAHFIYFQSLPNKLKKGYFVVRTNNYYTRLYEFNKYFRILNIRMK